MSWSDEEMLAAAEEAKKTPLFKRTKGQRKVIADAASLKFSQKAAIRELDNQRKAARLDGVDCGVREIDESDVEAVRAETAWIKGELKQHRQAEATRSRQQRRATKGGGGYWFEPVEFEGVTLTPTGVHYEGTKYPLTARATVESISASERRAAVAQLVVEGYHWKFVVDVDPVKGDEARRFAAAINWARTRLIGHG